MNPDPEIRRLLDVMPASGRMNTRLVEQPRQTTVLACPAQRLTLASRPIRINFELWEQLTQPQRDLLILRTVAWVQVSSWLKPELYQGGVVIGLLGTLVEFFQGDPLGVVAAVGLSAIATTQIWRNSHGLRIDIDADNTALKVSQRRGYSPTAAAQHLHSAIETVAQLEGRTQLTFNELLRCQNLKLLAGLSSVEVPDSV